MKILKLIWYTWVILAVVIVSYNIIKNVDNWLGVLGGIVFIIYIILMMKRETTDPKARRGRR